MKDRERIALFLFIFGAVFWFAENIYFGWHLKAESALEGSADFMVIVFWGLAFFIKPTKVERKKEIINYKVGKGYFNLQGKVNLKPGKG